MEAVRDSLSGHFILIADIDLDVAPYNADAGWEPIGTYLGWENPADQPFSGSFDGDSHTISGLFVDRPSPDGVGLFGHTAGATIQNLQLGDVNVTGRAYVGGLVGFAGTGTTISAVSSTGMVVADTRAGGLVGIAYDSTITDCRSESTASAINGTNAGGLAGQIEGTAINNSHATGDVSATQDLVGGLVGEARYASAISGCSATGAVSGFGDVGGLVGELSGNATVADSWATGAVDGHTSYRTGGLIGRLDNASTVSRSFATGEVSGGTHVGGLLKVAIPA